MATPAQGMAVWWRAEVWDVVWDVTDHSFVGPERECTPWDSLWPFVRSVQVSSVFISSLSKQLSAFHSLTLSF